MARSMVVRQADKLARTLINNLEHQPEFMFWLVSLYMDYMADDEFVEVLKTDELRDKLMELIGRRIEKYANNLSEEKQNYIMKAYEENWKIDDETVQHALENLSKF